MEYKVILTHNPQDFFEGIEPEDLTETVIIKSAEDLRPILDMVSGGYKAIITQTGSDACG